MGFARVGATAGRWIGLGLLISPIKSSAVGACSARPSRTNKPAMSLVVCGPLVAAAVDAAELVQRELSVEIVALPPIGPWDPAEVLRSVEKTSKVAILHENSGKELRAAEVAALIAEEGFEYLDAPVRRVCSPDQDVVAELNELAAY